VSSCLTTPHRTFSPIVNQRRFYPGAKPVFAVSLIRNAITTAIADNTAMKTSGKIYVPLPPCKMSIIGTIATAAPPSCHCEPARGRRGNLTAPLVLVWWVKRNPARPPRASVCHLPLSVQICSYRIGIECCTSESEEQTRGTYWGG
jgi:hypothetical protein